MTTPSVARGSTPTTDEWVERELAKAGPLTQEQQQELRRVLLGPQPIAAPA